MEQTVCAGRMEGDANFAPFNQFDFLKKGHLLLVCLLGADVSQLSHAGLRESNVFTRGVREPQPSVDEKFCRFACSEDVECSLAVASCGGRQYKDTISVSARVRIQMVEIIRKRN